MSEASLDELGPIDYVVVEFPENKMTGKASPFWSTSLTGESSACWIWCSSPRVRTVQWRSLRSLTSTGMESSI